MEIHLVKTAEENSDYKQKESVFGGCEFAVNRYGQRHKKKKTHCNGKQCVFILEVFLCFLCRAFSHR